jgi:tetratricopeptide (TPR) repeat protein
MSKYNTDLDYVIIYIDISREELEEIKAEADRIISENKESNENLALAYLKKAQCLRKLGSGKTVGFISYDGNGIFLYEEAGKFVEEEDLKNLLEKALELSPDMPEAFMQVGLLNRGIFGLPNKDEAKDFLSKAIQLKSDYAAAFNNRAMLYYQENILEIIESIEDKDNAEKNKVNYKNAVVDLTEAIRVRPFDAIYYLNRGVFHSRLGEHKEAVEDFSSAINNASDVLKDKLKTDALILNLRGKEYLELKEYSKAIEDFSETLRLRDDDSGFESKHSKPDYVETFLMRGKAYYLAGEKNKAKTDFEEYLNRKCNIAEDESRREVSEHIDVKPEDILLSEEAKQEMKDLADWCFEVKGE